MRRWAYRLAAAFALVVTAGGLGLYLYLRASLPEVAGEHVLPGLERPVEVVRDALGVPHIYAADPLDAYAALGFVHAQDRLFQMDLRRRAALGRLSEVAGTATLETDRLFRTLGFAQVAAANLEHLGPDARAVLDAYTRGINARIGGGGPLAPEFLLLGYRPEPWRPADTLAFGRLMAWDLSANWRDEMLRYRLRGVLSPERLDELLSPGLGGVSDATGIALPLPPLPAADLPGKGSNSWAVATGRSATGGALLANDTHLGLSAPAPWYLAHLSAPGLEVVGGTLPGIPGVLLGHNGKVAWGFTTTHSDVQDVIEVRPDPADPGGYLTPDGPAPFAVREETITLRGGGSETLRVRATADGPVVSDVLQGVDVGTPLALAWVGLDPEDRTFESFLALQGVADWPGFVGALEPYRTPQQNILYADHDGHIGFVAPGRVPIRAEGDGRAPGPGGNWRGFIPFADLPRSLDPRSGRLVTANSKIVPDGYPYNLTQDWPPPYRQERALTLLDAKPRHDLDGFMAMQTDLVSGMARDLLPAMLAQTPPADDARARTALERLAAWDGAVRPDAAEPLVFYAWLIAFGSTVYADELGDAYPLVRGLRPLFLRRVLREWGAWCDDTATPAAETCADRLALSLDVALEALGERYGGDLDAWRWDMAHVVRHPHPLSAVLPEWLRPLLDVEGTPGGDAFSLDVAAFAAVDPAGPFEATLGPTFRAVYDLANLDRSRFLQPTGQSGHFLSTHYANLQPLWAQGEGLAMRIGRVEGTTLRLLPAGE